MPTTNKANRRNRARYARYALALLLTTGVFATGLWVRSFAATNSTYEPEAGTLSGNVQKSTDVKASAGGLVQYSTAPSSFDPHQTLPAGAVLPSDATCTSRVTAATEVRPQNASQNATAGHNKNLTGGTFRAKVSGAYTGTTDQILQWVACKWGIDVDIVRAQAAKESYWSMSAKGDYTTDANSCPPAHGLGVDGTPGKCPESYGIIQDRWNYWGPPAGLNTWPEVETSTAYNLDLAYSSWRDCYEGNYSWLNTVERGATYAAGDAWGCVGIWFAGRWKTTDAKSYTQAVQDYFNTKIWTTSGFIGYRG
jgi:hypothetical protein